jgi:hypothetical protein
MVSPVLISTNVIYNLTSALPMQHVKIQTVHMNASVTPDMKVMGGHVQMLMNVFLNHVTVMQVVQIQSALTIAPVTPDSMELALTVVILTSASRMTPVLAWIAITRLAVTHATVNQVIPSLVTIASMLMNAVKIRTLVILMVHVLTILARIVVHVIVDTAATDLTVSMLTSVQLKLIFVPLMQIVTTKTDRTGAHALKA